MVGHPPTLPLGAGGRHGGLLVPFLPLLHTSMLLLVPHGSADRP